MNNLQPIDIKDYHYNLPNNRIAKFPLPKRDSSKLLVYKNNQIVDANFTEIANNLPPKSHLVFNNSKVIPARLFFENENGAHIEILLLKPYGTSYDQAFQATTTNTWECIIGNKKRWKTDKTIIKEIETSHGRVVFTAQFQNYLTNIITFQWSLAESTISFNEIIQYLGQIPLPPYLNREIEFSDNTNYQTIYSKADGAIAAPTAGLHFTETIFEHLIENKHTFQFITLHVGAGTFLPVKEEDALNHKMHREQIIFSLANIQQLLINIEQIIPVGTTSLRSIESLYWFGVKLFLNKKNSIDNNDFFIEKLYPYQTQTRLSPQKALEIIRDFMVKNNLEQLIGETEILIIPKYKMRICKGIITNFHQPQSTLLLLIASLIGKSWKKLYEHALKQNYRFLSYGDSSLLLP